MIAQPTRTAVYGPVRTVVWQGLAGDRHPYADLTGYQETDFYMWKPCGSGSIQLPRSSPVEPVA